MDNPHVFRLLLALMGLIALVAVLVTVAIALDGDAAAWVTGGAVTVAVAGIYALLTSLGKGDAKQ